MPVLAVGLSHHQATADELTAFTACAEQAAAELRAHPSVHGLVLLATCNRCEIYLEADRFHEAVRLTKQALARAGASSVQLELLDTYAARSAVEHLFQVACGLDSMVVGEAEIVGQVRAALAASNGQASAALHRCFQLALATSKLVTNATELGALGRSVASVGLDLVESKHGHLAGRRALLIGTGSYAGVVTADLIRRGATIEVHSASGRAAAFARTHPVSPVAAGELATALARAQVVIACSGNGTPAFTGPELSAARAGIFGMLPVVDLALGRDISPDLAALPGVDLIDLDQIGAHAPSNRTHQLTEAHRLVSQAVDSYLDVERRRTADPAVTAIRTHVNEIIASELDSVNLQQSPEVAEAVSRSLHRVANALLHTPSQRAAESAGAGELDDYTRALNLVFGIEVRR